MAYALQELVRGLCGVWGVQGRHPHVHRQRKSREKGRVLAWKDVVQGKEENGFLDLRKAVKKNCKFQNELSCRVQGQVSEVLDKIME